MTLSPALNQAINDLEPDQAIAIGGTWRSAAATFDVEDPATGTVITRVSDGSGTDATAAVDAADGAFGTWGAMAPRDRSAVLYETFRLRHDDTERLAGLIMAENGKSESDARAEVSDAAEFFRWFAEEAVRAAGAYGESPAGGARTVVTHRPVASLPW